MLSFYREINEFIEKSAFSNSLIGYIEKYGEIKGEELTTFLNLVLYQAKLTK